MVVYNRDHLTIIGNNHIINGDNCTVEGNINIINGDNCVVSGDNNVINGDNCVVSGDNNVINGDNCIVSGKNVRNDKINISSFDNYSVGSRTNAISETLVSDGNMNISGGIANYNGIPIANDLGQYKTMVCKNRKVYVDNNELVIKDGKYCKAPFKVSL
ncbi:MAG: hypothetical protein WD512_00440 [Candidatus Paceibacterota bacterium]